MIQIWWLVWKVFSQPSLHAPAFFLRMASYVVLAKELEQVPEPDELVLACSPELAQDESVQVC